MPDVTPPMPALSGARYVHTNLVALDWRRLAAFYVEVFGCWPAAGAPSAR